jgi:hypothetical protein
MHAQFVAAIHAKNKIRLTFFSKEDGSHLLRLCAPMDYGPKRKAKDQSDRFHMWDYDSDSGSHTLSLLPDQVVSIVVLLDLFDPSEFITWDTQASPWFVARNWGVYS